MTPIPLTNPSTIAPAASEFPVELAMQPLLFADQRQCKNKAAIFDALADKSRDDQCIAAIFRNACRHHYLAELNQIIKDIETRHGAGTVIINDNVKRILSKDQIDLIQESDGTVQLKNSVAHSTDLELPKSIDLTGVEKSTEQPGSLMGSDDRQITINEKNINLLITILTSADPLKKAQVIAAASRQNQIDYLNSIFENLGAENNSIDFSHVDLSNLNLTGIDLTFINLSHANLRNSCLVDAQLAYTNLTHANLNNANLRQANLTKANLTNARLIGANLTKAILNSAKITNACLLCAELQDTDLTMVSTLALTIFNFSTLNRAITRFCYSDFITEHVHASVNAIILRTLSDPIPSATGRVSRMSSKLKTVVIDENEKRLILSTGVKLTDNRDGTVQLRPGLVIYRDQYRYQNVDSTLSRILPKVLTDMISAYDEELEICLANRSAIADILSATDQTAKGLIITAASNQSKIKCLNEIFDTVRARRIKLDLSQVDLSNLDLSEINLNSANLTNAVMHGCKLVKANLRHAILVNANLNDACLVRAEFHHANMSHVRLIKADLSSANLFEVVLTGAIVKFANLENTAMNETNLTNAYLDHAMLKGTRLDNACLVNVSMTHASMSMVDLRYSNLTNAKMMHSKLIDSNLLRSNLTSVDLSGAQFKRVKLHLSMLTGSIWTGVEAGKIEIDYETSKSLPSEIQRHCVLSKEPPL